MDGLQGNNGLSGGQILAEADLAKSQNSREWGVNGFSSDGSLDVIDLSLGGFLLGGGVVVLRLGNDARLGELLRAAILNVGQIALGFDVGELRPFLPGIEFDQDVSLMHRLAGFEV